MARVEKVSLEAVVINKTGSPFVVKGVSYENANVLQIPSSGSDAYTFLRAAIDPSRGCQR